MVYQTQIFMIIKTAKFAGSSARLSQCPKDDRPEMAFIGRSNVGKSSLINMLTGRQRLAVTSSTPGKTTLINHFLINDAWYLVDLPGYGFARRSKAQQAEFRRMIYTYIAERPNLYCLFLLIDGNIAPQRLDLDFIGWLGEHQVPFCLIFTKSDKSKKSIYERGVQTFLEKLRETWEELPPHFIVSSEKKQGKEALLDYIGTILEPQGA